MFIIRSPSALFLSVIALTGCEAHDTTLSPAGVEDRGALEEPGGPGSMVEESFTVAEPDRLDLLFVVDNSCSMAEEQTSLANAVPGIFRALVDYGIDLHVGVVSTDMVDPEQSGRLRSVGDDYFIDETVDSPEDALSEMIMMGTAGSYDERGSQAAYSAIELLADSDNYGFYREDAKLAVVVLSDEDDYSGSASQNTEALTREAFVNWMLSLKPTADDVSFSSIVTPALGCPLGIVPGHEYLEVTSAVGGVNWSICDTDYGQALSQLGKRTGVDSNWFFLSQEPVEESIRVFVEGRELDSEDYRFAPQQNAIGVLRADEPIWSSDQVIVQYQVASIE
jgi:hypothetical protein